MENLKDILISPFGIIIVVFLILGYLLFVLAPKKEKARGKLLLEFFNGKFRSPMGAFEIPFQGHNFIISTLGSGQGVSHRSIFMLSAITEEISPLIIGNIKASKYSFFKINKVEKISTQINGVDIFIGTNDSSKLNLAKNIFDSNNDFKNELSSIFKDEFNFFTIDQEWQVGGTKLFKKVTILKMIGLPSEIMETPKILENLLKITLELFSRLEVTIK